MGATLFARVLEGARISLLVGIFGALVSFFIGTTYGLISGYAGGAVDSAMMRIVEILYAIPRLILIIIAIFTFDPSLAWLASCGAGGSSATRRSSSSSSRSASSSG